MIEHHIWDLWRGANELLAAGALLLHVVGWPRRSKASASSDMGFLANCAWSAGYLVATLTATFLPGGSPGPWTAIMSVPILWTFAAGVFLVRRPCP